MEKLRQLNDQGGRPIANVAAQIIGLYSEDAPTGKAGGRARQTYICNGAR